MKINFNLLDEFCEHLADISDYTRETIEKLEIQKNKLSTNTNTEHIVVQLNKIIDRLNEQLISVKRVRQGILRISEIYIGAESNIKNNIEGSVAIHKEVYINGVTRVPEINIDFSVG